MKAFLSLSTLFIGVLIFVLQFDLIQPKDHHEKNNNVHQQVHLSLGVDATEMIVTWATLKHCKGSFVEFGHSSSKLEHKVTASEVEFNRNASFFTHRALMTGLKPDTVYCKFHLILLDFA